MKAIERFKNSFINNEYYVAFYKNHIYIIGYLDIKDFSETTIKITFDGFALLIKGQKLGIIHKNNYELNIRGMISSIEVINE